MAAGRLGRRGALLAGAATLLAGCETLTDWTDSILGKQKLPLPGERLPVLAAERPLEVDEGVAPSSCPPPPSLDAWPQAGGTPTHAAGHPSLAAAAGAALEHLDRHRRAAYRRRLTAPPVIADGTGFAMDAYGQVTAVDLDARPPALAYDTRPKRDRDGALGGGCAFDGGVLYVVTGLAEAWR